MTRAEFGVDRACSHRNLEGKFFEERKRIYTTLHMEKHETQLKKQFYAEICVQKPLEKVFRASIKFAKNVYCKNLSPFLSYEAKNYRWKIKFIESFFASD